MTRASHFISTTFGNGGQAARARHHRAEELARGGQSFEPMQDVEVLDVDGQNWIPGRCIEQTAAFVRVEVQLPGRVETRKVVSERLRPREKS